MSGRSQALQRLAVDLALGFLEGSELDRAEALLADPCFRQAVAEVHEQLQLLVESAPELAPPAGTLRSIKQRIALQTEAQAGQAAAAQDLPPTTGAIGWRAVVPGVMVKLLRRDPGSGERTMLMRFRPGAVLPGHPHPTDEACLVLAGAVVSNNRLLRTGDYQAIPAGEPHAPVTSPEGALVFVRVAGRTARA
jgi:quercetin dioxygenase-like cupin family protein